MKVGKTTVSIYLSRAIPSAETSAPEDGRPKDVVDGDETVLIVEDNENVREVATVVVGSLGYRVISAADACEALTLIGRVQGIDMMVSDIVMSGGIDGFELARRARKLHPGLPILLMSGFPVKAETGEASEFPILRKPYRRDELARHIRAALSEPMAAA